jgi:nucleoside-triphosphatase THEP1
MRVRQLRATLDEFAAIYASNGHSEKAVALEALSRALKAANAKSVDELIPLVKRAATIAKTVDEVASSR